LNLGWPSRMAARSLSIIREAIYGRTGRLIVGRLATAGFGATFFFVVVLFAVWFFIILSLLYHLYVWVEGCPHRGRTFRPRRGETRVFIIFIWRDPARLALAEEPYFMVLAHPSAVHAQIDGHVRLLL